MVTAVAPAVASSAPLALALPTIDLPLTVPDVAQPAVLKLASASPSVQPSRSGGSNTASSFPLAAVIGGAAGGGVFLIIVLACVCRASAQGKDKTLSPDVPPPPSSPPPTRQYVRPTRDQALNPQYVPAPARLTVRATSPAVSAPHHCMHCKGGSGKCACATCPRPATARCISGQGFSVVLQLQAAFNAKVAEAESLHAVAKELQAVAENGRTEAQRMQAMLRFNTTVSALSDISNDLTELKSLLEDAVAGIQDAAPAGHCLHCRGGAGTCACDACPRPAHAQCSSATTSGKVSDMSALHKSLAQLQSLLESVVAGVEDDATPPPSAPAAPPFAPAGHCIHCRGGAGECACATCPRPARALCASAVGQLLSIHAPASATSGIPTVTPTVAQEERVDADPSPLIYSGEFSASVTPSLDPHAVNRTVGKGEKRAGHAGHT